MRMYNVATGQKVDETFKDSDMLNLADVMRRQVMFSYSDGDEYVFMDNEDYSQFSLNKDKIEDEVLFFNESTQGLQVVLLDDAPVALELPAHVELEITETDPSIKGGSATARTKPATMTTGLVIQVPEHISTGDVVKINVEDKKFMGRGEK